MATKKLFSVAMSFTGMEILCVTSAFTCTGIEIFFMFENAFLFNALTGYDKSFCAGKKHKCSSEACETSHCNDMTSIVYI